MERDKIIAMMLLYRRLKKRRNRIHWIHPLNQKRDEVGAFSVLFDDLRTNNDSFFNYFHMSIASFDELHSRLRDSLQRQNTMMRNCIQPEQMLAVTIRYLGSGCTFTELHNTYRIGISTVSKIVKEVCQSIWTVLRSESLKQPDQNAWGSITADFEKKINFPNCLGAVDGKYIRIIRPNDSGDKNYYAVVIMAVADSNYRFISAEIGGHGKECNSSIFKESELWTSIETDAKLLPSEKTLPGTQQQSVPHFFIADEGFAMHVHLLRPYGGKNLSTQRKVFNYRISRARRCVEIAFAVLSNKWTIFHRPMNVDPDFAVDITKACVVLHNFVLDRDGLVFEDTLTTSGFQDLQKADMLRGGVAANNVRNAVAEYFMSEAGAVAWQMEQIERDEN